jgi:hypothetical protein
MVLRASPQIGIRLSLSSISTGLETGIDRPDDFYYAEEDKAE